MRLATRGPAAVVPDPEDIIAGAARVPQPIYDFGLPIAGMVAAGLPGAAAGGAAAKGLSLARESRGEPLTMRHLTKTAGEMALSGAGTAGTFALGGAITKGAEIPVKAILQRLVPTVAKSPLGRVATSAAGGAASGAMLAPEGARVAGGVLGGVTGGAVQGVAEVARPAGRFLTGERGRIRKSEEHLESLKQKARTTIEKERPRLEQDLQIKTQQLEKSADDTVKQFRRGGRLATKFYEFVERESDKIWEPVRRLGRNLDLEAPITLDEINLRINTDYADDPRMAEQLRTFFAGVSKETGQSGRGLGGTELIETATAAGQKIRKAAHSGKVDRSASDQLYANARSLIADFIEERAPAHLKGEYVLAKQNWSDYASDRKEWFAKLSPGASPNLPRSTGANYLEKAVEGTLPIDELERLNRLQSGIGEDFLSPIKLSSTKRQLSKQQLDEFADKIEQSMAADIKGAERKVESAKQRGTVGKSVAGALGITGLIKLLGLGYGAIQSGSLSE